MPACPWPRLRHFASCSTSVCAFLDPAAAWRHLPARLLATAAKWKPWSRGSEPFFLTSSSGSIVSMATTRKYQPWRTLTPVRRFWGGGRGESPESQSKTCECDRQGVTESGCWEYGFPYRRWTVFHFSFPAKLSPRAKVCRAPPVPKSVGTECGDMATSIGLSGRDKRPTILQEAARSFLPSHTRHLVKMYGLAS